MADYNNLQGNIEPICIRIQKILPTVYTDALSYQDAMGQIVAKTNELVEQVNNFSDEVLSAAKTYTDGAIEESIKQYNQALQQFEADYDQFVDSVTGTLSGFQNQMDSNFARQDNEIAGSRAYTDTKIEQNNDWILEQITQQFVGILVLNPFTGERVTIQDMFDYLSALHMTEAAKIEQIVAAAKTVNVVVGYNATCTQMVNNGKNIFGIA